jgi:hypothetical protein
MDMETETQMGSAGDAVSIMSPAADLRVTLDRLLAEHALLATFAMQKGVDGAKDFDAIAGALDANTVDLGEAVGSVYGADAEKAFLKMWRAHIGFFVDYTVATAKKDEAGRAEARDALAGYQGDFATFLDGATGGKLPVDAASKALGAHVTQLTKALDSYAAGDHEAAYVQVRAAYHHMYMTGDALSGAIVAQKPEAFAIGDATQAASDLRIALDRLLAEHAGLATFAMQKGVDGSKDFKAIAAALDANTVDLGAAVGSVYGAEAEKAFLKMWRAHIGFFVDYTVATAKDDAAGKTKARDALAGYQADFSKFLDGATGGELPQSAGAEALGAHVSQLIDALDTYASGEYDTAYGEVREAYHHMFMTGDALAGAIVAQSPEKFEG